MHLDRMFRTGLKVLAADIVLIVTLFYVTQDLQWRSSYAGTLSYAPSFSYSVLTQFFTMARGTLLLTSPPTLDWVQTLAYALVVVNAWFVYVIIKTRRSHQPKGASLQVD
jgi:hypothetical protein